MNFAEYVKLAFNALRTNKVRSLLTMLGIIIGVASVILLVSIGTGLQNYVTEQLPLWDQIPLWSWPAMWI